jgi:hypothetical protein
MKLAGLTFVALGVFVICGAVFNWDWFMNDSKARFFTSLLGRTGARFFYVLFGCGLIVLGVLLANGVIPDPR